MTNVRDSFGDQSLEILNSRKNGKPGAAVDIR